MFRISTKKKLYFERNSITTRMLTQNIRIIDGQNVMTSLQTPNGSGMKLNSMTFY